jgi:hypothetical protein
VRLWYSDQLAVACILKGLNKIRSLGRGQKQIDERMKSIFRHTTAFSGKIHFSLMSSWWVLSPPNKLPT